MENVSFQPSGEEIERALMDLGPLLGVSIKEELPDEPPDPNAPEPAQINVGSLSEGSGSTGPGGSGPEAAVAGEAEGEAKGSADSLASPGTRPPLSAARCVLCAATLALTEGTPKLMECLHSACEPCIKAKIEERQANARDFLGAERITITCPACRLQCQPSNMIDQRFVLEKMALEQSGSNGTPSGEQQCNSCEDTEPATSYCVDCAEFICDNCVHAHQRLKITKDHTIKSKEEAVAELQAAQSHANSAHDMFCREHVQERLSLFCETCDRLTCRDCQLQHHRDHKYQFSTEMAAQARASIASLLSEVSYKRVLLGSAMKVIRDRQQLIADKKKALVHEITQTVVKLTNAINTRGKQLVLRLNEVCDAKQRTLSEKKDALEQLAAITDHCVEFVNTALEQGSDTALLYSKHSVSAHLQRIKSRRADIPNPEIPVRISLALDKLPDLIRVLSSIGAIVVDGKVDGGGAAQGPYHPPAPSPAGSPVPAPHAVSRFSVTRVTPERESSTESSSPSTPTRPTYCPTPSRFKVVQVAEPPQIQVHPASNIPRRCSSRFSVTRNYDSMYNPTLVSSPPPGPGPGPGHGRERLEGASSPVQTGSQPVSVPTSSSAVISEPIKRPLEETQTVPDVRKSEMTHNSELVMETTEIRPELTDVFVEPVTEIPLPVECHVDRINSNKEPFSTSGPVSSVSKLAADVNTAILAPETKECQTVSMSKSILLPTVVIESKVGATSLPGFETEVIESPESRLVSGNSTRHVIRCGISEYGSEKTQRPDIMVTRPDDETSENVLRSLAPIDNKLTESAKSDNNKDQIYISDAKNDETISKIDGDSENNITSIIKSNHNSPTGEEILGKNVKTYSDILKTDTKQTYKDKSEQLTQNEEVSVLGDDKVLKTETKLAKNSVELSETEKVDVQVEVTVKKESVQLDMQPAKVHRDQNVCEDSVEFINIDDVTVNKKEEKAIKQIEAITEDLGNLIKEMKDLTTKTAVLTKKDVKFRSDCTQTDIIDVNSKLDTFNYVPVKFTRDSVVLKKNKSESSLDSPDLEVSRLMNKKLVGSAFCDSSSSLEISGSSMESLNALDNQHNVTMIVTKPIIIQESIESDTELDRRKSDHVTLSTESSIESNTSEVTPVNSGNFLNMSVSSNESVSPIIFGKNKKIHDSLSSLEASVSSLDSGKQEKVMVTSADSGIEYSLQNPSDNKEDNSSNEGTLTNNSSLKDSAKKPESLQLQETLTSSPKRTSSLLDVPALKSKGLDRMRKISWVAPSSSFHIPRLDSDKTEAKPSHLEKLLSLFQHPSSIFSRSTQSDEERKSASNTPPRKDSSLTSTFWSWGSTIERVEKDDKDDSSEATDSTLSERVQVSFVDESFSKKLDSKTPSTDTDNTLSEFQSFPVQVNSETSDVSNNAEKRVDRVTDITTDDNLVQKCLGLSLKSTDNASSNGNRDMPRASDNIDLRKPNDLNKNVYETPNTPAGDNNRNSEQCTLAENDKSDVKQEVTLEDVKPVELIRPRSFAAVLKASGSENSLDKQISPESGQLVDKLPSKIIRGIKENISPENTLTSSMTKALAFELTERQVKNQPIVNTVWEVTARMLEKNDSITEDVKIHSDLAPIATIEETCDEAADNNIQLDFIDDIKCTEDKNISLDSGVTSLEAIPEEIKKVDTKNVTDGNTTLTKELENIDLGKDALSYLIYENQDFEPDPEHSKGVTKIQHGSLAQELKEAEIKEMLDLSPELIIDEAIEVPEVFTTKEMKGLKTSPVIPERAKLKKSNSLEDLSQLQDTEDEKTSPKAKTIVFKVPETTSPRDIPERRTKLRTRSGSSPKSLPESLNKPCPLTKIDSILSKKKKKVSSLGKMAKDSLLALNMSEDEIAEFRRSYKLTSVESLRSLESVSEDANSQSGNSIDSRCRACLRTSQESLMSLDSITEDCRCGDLNDKPGHSAR